MYLQGQPRLKRPGGVVTQGYTSAQFRKKTQIVDKVRKLIAAEKVMAGGFQHVRLVHRDWD
jgi:hypothetical protein